MVTLQCMTSVAATRPAQTAGIAVEGITMKAVTQDRYGAPDVLRLADVAIPELEADSVLVRVRAASVNALDWHMIRGQPFLVRVTEGLRRPKNALNHCQKLFAKVRPMDLFAARHPSS